MSHYYRQLLAKAVGYTLTTILTLGVWGAAFAFLRPAFGVPDAILMGALWAWLCMFALTSPIVKVEMWIARPRPIKVSELKGLAEMAADEARRKEKRLKWRRRIGLAEDYHEPKEYRD